MNLDADDELCAFSRAATEGREKASPWSRRVTKSFVRARITERFTELSALVAGGVLVGAGREDEAKGLPGRAFCPTPGALVDMAAVGAIASPAPPLEVLARANHRLFSANLGQTLEGAIWVEDEAALASAFAELVHPSTSAWVLKHPHGYVGRMRHKTRELDARTRAFAVRCFSDAGGLALEPWVERHGDYAIHGFLGAEGADIFGAPTRQVCDANGAWQTSTRSHDLECHEVEVLEAEARRVANSLREIGYFGPFGVDAFRYRATPGEAVRFNPRCEVNARYTMGWAIGTGDARPDLVASDTDL